MATMLAPVLGRLASPARHGPFDEVRLMLVDALVSARASGNLDGSAWLSAWQRAMESIRDQVMTEANAAIDDAAKRSRFPGARLVQLRPNAEAAETLLNRLLAEGEPLERLDGPATDDAITRARGAALEAGWDAAIRIASAERGHWMSVARDVDQWRRPWRPLVIAATITFSAVLVVAAMLGGVIPAPNWFQPVTDWFWNLPWP
jgi:hypothetical protein